MAQVVGKSFELSFVIFRHDVLGSKIDVTIDVNGDIVIDDINVNISNVDVINFAMHVHNLIVNIASCGLGSTLVGAKACATPFPHCLNLP